MTFAPARDLSDRYFEGGLFVKEESVETLSPLDRQALQSIHEISDSCRRGFIEGRITEFPSAFSRVVNYQCVSFYWCVEWYSFFLCLYRIAVDRCHQRSGRNVVNSHSPKDGVLLHSHGVLEGLSSP